MKDPLHNLELFILAGNFMVFHERMTISIIDFGKARLRCEKCSVYNNSSKNQEPNCCKEWHDGRMHDMRAAASLIYQLVMAPKSSESEVYEKAKEYIKAKVPPCMFLFIICKYFILGEREMFDFE